MCQVLQVLSPCCHGTWGWVWGNILLGEKNISEIVFFPSKSLVMPMNIKYVLICQSLIIWNFVLRIHKYNSTLDEYLGAVPSPSSVQFSSVTQSYPTPCNPMNGSTLGLPVHHQLPEVTQTHAHRIGDAIQPPHPLSSSSPPAPNPSQHQGLFQWVNSSHEVAKVLELQPQHQSLQWTPRTDLLWDGLVGSPCSPRDFQESSPTLQFKSISFSALSFLHSPTLTSIHDLWKNHSIDQTDLCWQSNVSAF